MFESDNKNELKILEIAKSISTVMLLAVVICILIYAKGMTLGWFVTSGDVQGNAIEQRMKVYNYPTMTMWTYNTTAEAGSTGTAGWIKWPETEMSAGTAITYIPETGLKTLSYELKKLQFGTIDNLVRIKDDNTVYLRFKVTPEKIGDPFRLWVQTQTKENGGGEAYYPFTIYDDDDPPSEVPTTDQAYERVRLIIEGDTDGGSNPLFKYYYATSNSKYEDPSTFAEQLTFEEMENFSKIAATTDSYYVYVKIQPFLNTFAKIAEPLTRAGHMPCFILYDFNIFFTVKDID